MKFTKKTIYIGLFGILYLIVAFSSFWHAVAFFGLANNSWMSIILAFAFEVGQAAVLFSLLTSPNDRKRIMPWVLMTTFTLVQVIGNVYSSYKHIVLNSVDNLKYFKEPIFIWTKNLPDDQANVIIVYLVGAILPICSLLLTSMITNYLSDQEEIKQLENKNNDNIDNDTAEEDKDNSKEDPEKHNEDVDIHQEEVQLDEKKFDEFNKDAENIVFKEKNEEIDKLKKEIEDLKNPKIHQIPVPEIYEPIPFSEPERLIQLKKENEQREEKPNSNDDQQSVEDNGDQGTAKSDIKEEVNESVIQDESIKNETKSDSPDDDKDNEKRESHFINLK